MRGVHRFTPFGESAAERQTVRDIAHTIPDEEDNTTSTTSMTKRSIRSTPAPRKSYARAPCDAPFASDLAVTTAPRAICTHCQSHKRRKTDREITSRSFRFVSFRCVASLCVALRRVAPRCTVCRVASRRAQTSAHTRERKVVRAGKYIPLSGAATRPRLPRTSIGSAVSIRARPTSGATWSVPVRDAVSSSLAPPAKNGGRSTRPFVTSANPRI